MRLKKGEIKSRSYLKVSIQNNRREEVGVGDETLLLMDSVRSDRSLAKRRSSIV